MSTAPEAFSQMSREDLIGTINALEDSLAEAATGLMTEGSAQEYARLKRDFAEACQERDEAVLDLYSIPRLIRWWYGC